MEHLNERLRESHRRVFFKKPDAILMNPIFRHTLLSDYWVPEDWFENRWNGLLVIVTKDVADFEFVSFLEVKTNG